MVGLTLTEWFEVMGFHPWHSWQLANSSVIPITADCSTVVREYAWQNTDAVGRHEIRQAIENAEQLIHRYAEQWPTPRYNEVTLPVPQPGDNRFYRYIDANYRGQWLGMTLPDSEILCAGVATDSAAETVSATYSDEDGDTLNETVTLTATVPSGTTSDQVIVRFLEADSGTVRPPELRPRRVTLVGTTATIILNGWECVKPVHYQGVSTQPLDPGLSSNFATQFEVFRRYCNSAGTTVDTAQAVLTWESRPCDWPLWCIATGNRSDPAATASALARVTLRNTKAGIVAFGESVYNTETGEWTAVTCDLWRCNPPDHITFRYQSGTPLVDLRVSAFWRPVIARLAAAELTRPVCGCTAANKELYEWQQDLSRTGATDELFAAPNNLTNPLGARRGHIWAWNQIQREQRGTGIFAG